MPSRASKISIVFIELLLSLSCLLSKDLSAQDKIYLFPPQFYIENLKKYQDTFLYEVTFNSDPCDKPNGCTSIFNLIKALRKPSQTTTSNSLVLNGPYLQSRTVDLATNAIIYTISSKPDIFTVLLKEFLEGSPALLSAKKVASAKKTKVHIPDQESIDLAQELLNYLEKELFEAIMGGSLDKHLTKPKADYNLKAQLKDLGRKITVIRGTLLQFLNSGEENPFQKSTGLGVASNSQRESIEKALREPSKASGGSPLEIKWKQIRAAIKNLKLIDPYDQDSTKVFYFHMKHNLSFFDDFADPNQVIFTQFLAEYQKTQAEQALEPPEDPNDLLPELEDRANSDRKKESALSASVFNNSYEPHQQLGFVLYEAGSFASTSSKGLIEIRAEMFRKNLRYSLAMLEAMEIEEVDFISTFSYYFGELAALYFHNPQALGPIGKELLWHALESHDLTYHKNSSLIVYSALVKAASKNLLSQMEVERLKELLKKMDSLFLTAFKISGAKAHLNTLIPSENETYEISEIVHVASIYLHIRESPFLKGAEDYVNNEVLIKKLGKNLGIDIVPINDCEDFLF